MRIFLILLFALPSESSILAMEKLYYDCDRNMYYFFAPDQPTQNQAIDPITKSSDAMAESCDVETVISEIEKIRNPKLIKLIRKIDEFGNDVDFDMPQYQKLDRFCKRLLKKHYSGPLFNRLFKSPVFNHPHIHLSSLKNQLLERAVKRKKTHHAVMLLLNSAQWNWQRHSQQSEKIN